MENPLRRHSSTSRTRRCTARRAVTLAVLPVVAYLTGCVTTNFTQPVASFQKSINTTTAAVGVYYTTLNSFERDLYLTHLALNPGEPLEATDKAGSPTPLLGTYFQPASIAARMDTLSLLGVYAQKLTDLAGNDAPQQAVTATTALGASVTNLTTTFTGLTDPKAADKSAAQYVAPVSALGGSLLKMYLATKRSEAIQEAVTNGAPKVDALLALVQNDLVTVIKPLQETGVLEKLADATRYYNANSKSMSLPDRRASLAEIGALADAYEAAVAFNPKSLIQAASQANAALLKYATAPTVPQNFSAFVTALSTFEQNANEVATAVTKVRQALGGK